jgi:hypothetical protein
VGKERNERNERNEQGNLTPKQTAMTDDVDTSRRPSGPQLPDAATPAGRRATFIVWFSVCLALVLLVAFNMR